MKASAAIATLSRRKRRQNSWSGERAVIAPLPRVARRRCASPRCNGAARLVPALTVASRLSAAGPSFWNPPECGEVTNPHAGDSRTSLAPHSDSDRRNYTLPGLRRRETLG